MSMGIIEDESGVGCMLQVIQNTVPNLIILVYRTIGSLTGAGLDALIIG